MRASTPEAVVRGEFFALGPPAWNANETLACERADRASGVRSTRFAGGRKAISSRRLGGIRIGPLLPFLSRSEKPVGRAHPTAVAVSGQLRGSAPQPLDYALSRLGTLLRFLRDLRGLRGSRPFFLVHHGKRRPRRMSPKNPRGACEAPRLAVASKRYTPAAPASLPQRPRVCA